MNDKLNELLQKLYELERKQSLFSREIDALKSEIKNLSAIKEDVAPEEKAFSLPPKMEDIPVIEAPRINPPKPKTPTPVKAKSKSEIEKFIGENLISKVGIAITVIGVAIGAKYSIDHNLISPLARIILGYLMGIGLLGFGMKLKAKYENFSAVLVSGAMAIMFFITYLAYSLYALMPQAVAFVMMVVCTVFTVIAAVVYDKKIIAHIGLVGAYSVPFMLSDGSGNAAVLFSYMTILNIGILVLSFKKYWKSLFISSFAITWLIFMVWIVADYDIDKHFVLASIFLTLFFIIFYTTALAYKLLRNEKFKIVDVILICFNAFIFFGLGYGLLNEHKIGSQLIGLFALFNAALHFAVSIVLHKRKLADKNLFYLVTGLVFLFIAIAIPIQLDGNWVTLSWLGLAVLLFWIGRTKSVYIYEILSYPLMLLAFISIVQDWGVYYNLGIVSPGKFLKPVLNIMFLTSIFSIIAFGIIYRINEKAEYKSALDVSSARVLQIGLVAVLVVLCYYAFRLEISNYYLRNYLLSEITLKREYNSVINNYDIIDFRTMWIANYSLLFFAILSFIGLRKKNILFGWFNIITNLLFVFLYLTIGLLALSELRESYLSRAENQYYHVGILHITIRYISYLFFGLMMYACYLYSKQDFIKVKLKNAFDYLFHISLVWIASSELIHWMDMMHSTQTYKLGLSILWGLYGLFLIAYGILRQKIHLRIAGLALFVVTLLKLFFYDISHLNTIAKTIVFVSLGVLLLIVSFLYNKYKNRISDENKN